MEAEGRPWGAANGAAIDGNGMSVWVADRCGADLGVRHVGKVSQALG
jgi:hypothetical protein